MSLPNGASGYRSGFHPQSGLWSGGFATTAFAQVSATLSGTVVDSSGAAVTSASVTATNVSTGAVVNATSDKRENTVFFRLRPASMTW